MTDALILAIDQGTSSTKALLVSGAGIVVRSFACPVDSMFPAPGWVEQSAERILDSVGIAVAGVLDGVDPARVVAVGLTNQRESLVLWDRKSGMPVGPLISWQDQRTTDLCAQLAAAGHGELVRKRSGLPLDPMFSAIKARWLLDHHDPDRSRSVWGQLCLGTVDSWLMFRLTGDHIADVGNASRTQLMDVRSRTWDPELLELFGIPGEVLPRIASSVGPFPTVRGLAPLLDGTPLTAVLGDSHAALFAHAGWSPGVVKATYGTGSSVMGIAPVDAADGDQLCLTVAWDDGAPAYAVEGNIRSSGSTLSWLARTVDRTPAELAALAANASSDGVHLVPAFSGLAAPWWDADAVGVLTGLTFGTGLAQLARAALESVVFQVEDVVTAVDGVAGRVGTLLADGGASANPVLMQLQADISGRTVERAMDTDLSPLGVAHLAGRAAGVWSASELEALPRPRETFLPSADADARRNALHGWRLAVRTSRRYGRGEER